MPSDLHPVFCTLATESSLRFLSPLTCVHALFTPVMHALCTPVRGEQEGSQLLHPPPILSPSYWGAVFGPKLQTLTPFCALKSSLRLMQDALRGFQQQEARKGLEI